MGVRRAGDAASAARAPRRRLDRGDGRRGLRRRVLRQAGDPPLPRRDGPAHPRAVPVLAADYEGEAESVWRDVTTGDELYRRLRPLPGYGDEKSKIFVAILAKTQGVAPDGWREAAGKFGDDVPRSVADIHGPESLAAVREWKRAQKAAKRDKQDRPPDGAARSWSPPEAPASARCGPRPGRPPRRPLSRAATRPAGCRTSCPRAARRGRAARRARRARHRRAGR